MDLGLKNKKAVLLASTRGLARAVAEALAGEGCSVAICGRDGAAAVRLAAELADRFEITAHGAACDVSSATELDRFLKGAVAALGGVDILVNNCGGPPPGAIEAFDDTSWQSAIELVLMSVIRSCRRILPIMKQARSGRVITITSVAVKQPLPNMVLSNTTRAAVAAYMKTVANEVAPFGILVHCVMPGSFLTDRNLTLGADIARARAVPLDELITEWSRAVPLGRMGQPAEFGQFVAFLASERCSFATGTCLAVDGGQIRGVV